VIEALVIAAADGDQVYPAERCPLIAGGTVRSALRLPGAGPRDEPLLFDLSAGQAFVQPGAGAATIHYNGRPLIASQWLRDGDRISVREVELRCRVEGEQMRLELGRAQEGVDTLPPLTSKPPAEDTGIVPAAFDRPGTRRGRRGGRVNLLPVLVALSFVVLAVVAWYTFSARSVLIELYPAAAELSVEGSLLPVRFGDRFLLRPGEYRVRARLAGYYPLDESLAVSAERDQAVAFELEKLPGRVTITTQGVTRAEVMVNGEPVGVAPLVDLEIPAGPNRVAVQASRYLDFRTELQVVGMGEPQALEVRLIPGWAEVSMTSDPAGARLLVDGSEVGITPQSLQLMAGQHDLTLRLTGYDDWTTSVQAVANEPLDLGPLALVKSRALLALSSRPAGALVQMDGVFQGRTPLELALVPDQSHEITLTRSGYQPVRQSVQLEPGQREALELRLGVVLGTVRIAAEPADAGLWVDGVARGKATQRLRLSTAPHRIEIRKPGYLPYQTTVTPKPGLEQEVAVKLSKAGAGTGGGTVPTTRVRTPDGQTLVYVGPGRFTMGASRREQGRRSNESLREVELTRPYYIAVREVSNGRFRSFDPAHRSGAHGGQSLDLDDQPVVNVSWDQAARYCNWLSAKEALPPAYRHLGGRMVTVLPTTRGYRLPTEAEWAWAARGATAGRAPRYPWGGSWPPPSRSGNYADRSAASTLPGTLPDYDDGFAASAPVGSYPPGRLGLMDMGGNVSEWVQDVYSIYPVGAALERDPLGPAAGRHHVIRGSSWRDGSIGALRLSYRDYGGSGNDELGFRVARYAD
jgi:formylglycine-generating enzyme required for sulfatase activity